MDPKVGLSTSYKVDTSRSEKNEGQNLLKTRMYQEVAPFPNDKLKALLDLVRGRENASLALFVPMMEFETEFGQGKKTVRKRNEKGFCDIFTPP